VTTGAEPKRCQARVAEQQARDPPLRPLHEGKPEALKVAYVQRSSDVAIQVEQLKALHRADYRYVNPCVRDNLHASDVQRLEKADLLRKPSSAVAQSN
jgi:hypothetical protein